jgi:hypothetical protein
MAFREVSLIWLDGMDLNVKTATATRDLDRYATCARPRTGSSRRMPLELGDELRRLVAW